MLKKYTKKGLKPVFRVVNSLKNQYKWPKLDLKMNEWSSKYRILTGFFPFGLFSLKIDMKRPIIIIRRSVRLLESATE